MKKLIVITLGCSLAILSHAQRYDVYVHDQSWQRHNDAPPRATDAVIDTSDWSKSFKEGQDIRKAWDARKARKQHEKAMQEMSSLNLNDNDAVMEFAKKYPDSIDSLKSMLQLHKQLND
ncbi:MULTISPECIES: hypothetical protein [Psychrobacter]|uniref:Uncharacterized protein n=1 Tax=Psychrobacter namhaensis TaxID=292734 RepID=A0ABW8LAA0_9GAMM|nr:hypothetical protein [Psychrobacter proteolyticus]